MSDVQFTQSLGKLQAVVNSLKNAYSTLHKTLESSAVIEYEKKLYELQMQTGKTIKETEALGKELSELAKSGQYSTKEMGEMATTLTSLGTTYDMTNDKIKESLDMFQKRWPQGMNESIKALQKLTSGIKGLSGAFSSMKLGDAMHEFMAFEKALQGDIDGINEMNNLLTGGKKDLMPTAMAKKGRDVAVEEAHLRYSQTMSGTAQSVYGKEAGVMNTAGQAIVGAGHLAQAGTALGQMWDSGKKWLGIKDKKDGGGEGGGGGREGSSGDGQHVFVTNWPEGGGSGKGGSEKKGLLGQLWDKAKEKIGWEAGKKALQAIGSRAAGAAGGAGLALAGGAALTAAGLYASTVMMNRHPAGARMREGMKESNALHDQVRGAADTAINPATGMTATAEASLKKRQIDMAKKMVLRSGEQEVASVKTSQSDKELDIAETTGQHWTTKVALQKVSLDASKAEYSLQEKMVADSEGALKLQAESLAKKLASNSSEKEKFEAQVAYNHRLKQVEESRLELANKRSSIEAKNLAVIQKEYDGRMKMISFDERKISAAQRIAKATYMPPGAQVELGMQSIEQINKKISAQEKMTAQLEAQRAIAISSADTVAKKEEAKKKFTDQILESKTKTKELEADKAEAADYTRRSWMEQFSETMMGGESGTYLTPGSGQLSGMQEKGAAFSPFGDANRGGGMGTYGDIYSKFDPALQESRTAAERGIMDSASGKFVTALDEFANRLVKTVENAVHGG